MFSIKIEGIAEIDRSLKLAMASYPQKVAQAMYTEAIATLIPAMRENLRRNTSIFTGNLHQRLVAKIVSSDPRSIIIDVGALGVPYGMEVEAGGPPREEPLDRLVEWIKKKGIVHGKLP